MATHKSAAKRARQTVRKTAVNGKRKSTVKTFEKSLLKALDTKSLKDIPELLKTYTSQIMKAAQRGVFKREKAARKIGRLTTRVSNLLGK